MFRSSRPPVARSVLFILVAVLALAGLAACSDDNGGGGGSSSDSGTLRLGYFPNVTHAPGLIAIENDYVEDNLPDGWSLDTQDFNAGGEVIQALLAGQLDASFIGPNPAINGYAQSLDDGGGKLRIVSGVASGGAFLVVDQDIQSFEDLEGATLSSPALGNTQDVAMRAWLAEQDFDTTLEGGGDVSIQPQENPQILTTFSEGQIDGAWVPEPWATRLIEEGDGHILLDERDLWPDGQYVTTHLIVQTDFLEDNPEVVKALIEANLEALALIENNREEAETVVAAAIENVTGRAIPPHLVTASFDNIEFTWDPIASSLQKSADDAIEFDLLDPVDLDGIYNLAILNEILAERDLPPVDGL